MRYNKAVPALILAITIVTAEVSAAASGNSYKPAPAHVPVALSQNHTEVLPPTFLYAQLAVAGVSAVANSPKAYQNVAAAAQAVGNAAGNAAAYVQNAAQQAAAAVGDFFAEDAVGDAIGEAVVETAVDELVGGCGDKRVDCAAKPQTKTKPVD